MARKTTAKTEESPFKIHEPVMLGVHQLSPAAYNPNKLPPKKFQALKDLIREVGFAEPIVVQKGSLMLIAGHHRIRALKELCVEEGVAIPKVPAIVLDVDDRTAKRLNIAFNKVHGEPDPRLLGELLIQIKEDAPVTIEEIETMGFDDQPEFDKYVRLVEPITTHDEPAPTIETFGKSVTLSLEFKDVGLRDAVKAAILDKATTSKKTTGELVADLLGCRMTKSKAPKKKAA